MKAFNSIAIASLCLFAPEETVQGKIRPQVTENELTGFVESSLTHTKKVRAPVVGASASTSAAVELPNCLFKDD